MAILFFDLKSSKRIFMKMYLVAVLILANYIACNRQSFEKSPVPQPYKYITARAIGEKVPYSPDRIIDWRWDNPNADDELEIYTIKPFSVQTDVPGSFDNLSSLKKKSANVLVKGNGSIMMDFGQENAAWLEFDSKDFSGEVTMSISEYNEPAILNEGAQNRFKTKAPVKYGNTYRLELNDELYEGVRFGWIHINTFEKEWHIDNVRLVCQIKPVNYMGSFSCNDTLLNRIWYTGAYGVKLNLLKDFFGAILMERSDRFAWTGDSYPSQAASLVAFANYDFIKKNIFHTSLQNNGIESYSLYWIQSLSDYFYYSGDTTTIIHFIDNACEKLDHAYEIFGTDPNLTYYGWDERLGAGFLKFNNKNDNQDEVQNAFKMLTIESWNDFSKMMKEIGKNELSEKYKAYAHEKLEQLRFEKNWTERLGLHAASDAINTGLLNEPEKQQLYERVFTNRQNRLSFSPFNQYFIIQALSALNKYDVALETIRDHWGSQIKYGATTFVENFHPSWNQVLNPLDPPPNGQCGYTSLAHPWGGGVVKWISEEILGVKPLNPGFESVEIMPHLGRTLTFVNGEMPTPKGNIQVYFDVAAGLGKVEIPQGIKAKIGIPKVEREIISIRLNGKPEWPNRKADQAKNNLIETNEFIIFSELAGGTYNFKIEYRGSAPEFEQSELEFPASFIKQDSLTQGCWNGRYGKDGYILFNYIRQNGKPAHLKSFSKDIVDVYLNINADSIWQTNVDDIRVPEPDIKQTHRQNASAIFTRDPIACFQTMTIDIKLAEECEYEFSLYFLDWDNQSRRTAIEVFDLKTKNMITPVQIVDNYSMGKYMTFRYSKSVRFRINHVRGPNAVVSGLFFDRSDQKSFTITHQVQLPGWTRNGKIFELPRSEFEMLAAYKTKRAGILVKPEPMVKWR